ncbi:hypothetical protein GALMADRAFT_136152 [Galerina marginata CBS 339.88]|uniref:Uncharacterized protein n=1 Tax=Galerina marginata (strain CBS 339.88) TaxID=685588 RepID=A0A067TQ45_GALM3|nr:hypothetical protein GALMADRAFT_136152 [Galerina marginata CBS 339.88]
MATAVAPPTRPHSPSPSPNHCTSPSSCCMPSSSPVLGPVAFPPFNAKHPHQRPFSFRRHFKNSRRPHELAQISTHRMPDTGTVTSLTLDADWVVVGLAGSMIKVFDTRMGLLCRTPVGHDSGVSGV